MNRFELSKETMTQEALTTLLAELNCCLLEVDFPMCTRGMTLKELDGYVIYLNQNLCQEDKLKTLWHELTHLRNRDFQPDRYINQKPINPKHR